VTSLEPQSSHPDTAFIFVRGRRPSPPIRHIRRPVVAAMGGGHGAWAVAAIDGGMAATWAG
jgi:hypothetical protein